MQSKFKSLNKAVYISYSTNTLGKSINPNILSLAMGKIVRQTGLFNLGIGN